jgi:hypothetical protein
VLSLGFRVATSGGDRLVRSRATSVVLRRPVLGGGTGGDGAADGHIHRPGTCKVQPSGVVAHLVRPGRARCDISIFDPGRL